MKSDSVEVGTTVELSFGCVTFCAGFENVNKTILIMLQNDDLNGGYLSVSTYF